MRENFTPGVKHCATYTTSPLLSEVGVSTMVIVVGVMLSSAIRGGAGAGGAKKTAFSKYQKKFE